MANSTLWDVVIIGGGVIGSWAGYHLAKSGQQVVILEQFSVPHSRGSSHGQTRVIRKAYHNRRYASMMGDAYDLWIQLQEDSGCQLFQKTGMLCVEDGNQKENTKYSKIMDEFNLPYNRLTNQDLKHYYPQLKFPPDFQAVFDPAAGLLAADKCMTVLRDMYKEVGGILNDWEKVEHIQPGNTVVVTTNKAKYCAKSVIVTPGPWANDVLVKTGINLPLKTLPGWFTYWPTTNSHMKAENGFPVINYNLNLKEGYRFVILKPEYEYPGLVKIVSRGEPATQYVHPDRRAYGDNTGLIDILKKFIKENTSGVEDTPALVESCMYTMTPDQDYIIDRHPLFENIIIGAGFSGTGFISGPASGKVLGELALGLTPSYDISALSLSRFGDVSLHKSYTVASKL